MKLLNYDRRELILQNVRSVAREVPTTYTKSQYRILCNLIKQKHITKQFLIFYFCNYTDYRTGNS